jgi:hypothetical protein
MLLLRFYLGRDRVGVSGQVPHACCMQPAGEKVACVTNPKLLAFSIKLEGNTGDC